MEKKSNVKETKKKDEKVEKTETKKGLTKETKSMIFNSIGVIAVVLLVLGFAYWTSLSYGQNVDYEFTYIDVDKYISYMKDSEARIIYVAKPDCTFCQQETPIIKRIASKYNLTINYLDTTDFLEHDDEGNVKYDEEGNAIKTETGKKFVASAEEYKDGWGTPNTIIVKDGKIVDGIYQYVEESELKTLFKNNGFI